MGPLKNDPSSLSWEEYRYHLTSELERMSGLLERVVDKIDRIENKQVAADARAKVHGSLYGFGAAALVEIGRALISLIPGHGR